MGLSALLSDSYLNICSETPNFHQNLDIVAKITRYETNRIWSSFLQLLSQQLFLNTKLSPKPWYDCLEKKFKVWTKWALVPLWMTRIPIIIMKYQTFTKTLIFLHWNSLQGMNSWVLSSLWPTLKHKIVLKQKLLPKPWGYCLESIQ